MNDLYGVNISFHTHPGGSPSHFAPNQPAASYEAGLEKRDPRTCAWGKKQKPFARLHVPHVGLS